MNKEELLEAKKWIKWIENSTHDPSAPVICVWDNRYYSYEQLHDEPSYLVSQTIITALENQEKMEAEIERLRGLLKKCTGTCWNGQNDVPVICNDELLIEIKEALI